MLKSRRSPLAALALLSLVATLLALPVMPAAAKNGEADDLPLYTACPSSAIESAGFEDVSSRSVAWDAINCIAHYGIMPGTSSTTFQPGLGVTRQEMALILIRAAGPAGIDVPRVRDQGFDDIGDLPREARDAINQLAQLGITRGTSASTYTPDRVVNRRQMAQFFTRFLVEAPVGDGGVDIETVLPDDRVFTDIENLPYDPFNAIRLIYELGVTEGTTPTTYSPTRPVTRAQMALFVSRMLAHTNARPAGITMQAEDTSITAEDTVDLLVSLRDDNHQPVTDAPIDLFYVAAGDEGFASNGRCSRKAIIEAGYSRCVIDDGDETTYVDGNLLYTMDIPESLTVYAWTGSRHERLDIGSTVHAALAFTASKSPDGFLLTDDMPEGARDMPFGATVTFTFQVVDEDLNPIAEEGAEIRIRVERWNDGRRLSDRPARTYDTDPSGRVQLTFSLPDPDPDRDNRNGEFNLDVLRHDFENMTDHSQARLLGPDNNRLWWSDADPDPATLLLTQDSVYSRASNSGSAQNRVSATLIDQYGNAVRGKRVHFTSNDEHGLHSRLNDDGTQNLDQAQSRYHRSTTRRGVATVSYTRNSNDTGVERIYVTTADCPVCNPNIDHYWVDFTPTNVNATDVTVLHYDADADTLIIRVGTVGVDAVLYGIAFDSFEHFFEEDESDVAQPISFQAFKEALARYADDDGAVTDLTIDVNIASNDPDDVNRFTLP